MSERTRLIIAELKKSQHKKSAISIRRGRIDSHFIDGFVLGVSDVLVALQYKYDFRLDGLMFLRIADITEVRSTATDRFQQNLMQGEGLLDRIPFDAPLNLQSWETIIEQLSAFGGLMIVESEKPGSEDFILGQFLGISQRTAFFKFITGIGRWLDEPASIRLKDITCCQVETNYANFYQRYFDRLAIKVS
jgi:hypothetical protein